MLASSSEDWLYGGLEVWGLGLRRGLGVELRITVLKVRARGEIGDVGLLFPM